MGGGEGGGVGEGGGGERGAARLRVFLERPRIYQTLELAVLEAPARANLVRSLARLTASPRA